MKKTFTLIALFSLQIICFSQIITKKVKDIDIKKITKSNAVADKMVMYEFTLNYIAIAEASRNRIDNNDCRQTWGEVVVTFHELDENGQKIEGSQIITDLNDYTLFDLPRSRVPHQSNSYYSDRMGVNEDNFIKKISVRVSENLIKKRRVIAIVSCKMQNAHKDNDFASFDHLRMVSNESATFYLEDISSKQESMSVRTNGKYTYESGRLIENGGNSDDTHRIWLHFTIKKKS